MYSLAQVLNPLSRKKWPLGASSRNRGVNYSFNLLINALYPNPAVIGPGTNYMYMAMAAADCRTRGGLNYRVCRCDEKWPRQRPSAWPWSAALPAAAFPHPNPRANSIQCLRPAEFLRPSSGPWGVRHGGRSGPAIAPQAQDTLFGSWC